MNGKVYVQGVGRQALSTLNLVIWVNQVLPLIILEENVQIAQTENISPNGKKHN